MGYNSKYNKTDAETLENELDVIMTKLETLGYNNSSLTGFIDHLNTSNTNGAATVSIWHGNSAKAFVSKVELYLKNVKTFKQLVEQYRVVASMMADYEDMYSTYKNYKDEENLLYSEIQMEKMKLVDRYGTIVEEYLNGYKPYWDLSEVEENDKKEIEELKTKFKRLEELAELIKEYQRKLDTADTAINNNLTADNSRVATTHVVPTTYSHYAFSLTDLPTEFADFKKEAENFQDVNISIIGSSDSTINSIIETLRNVRNKINDYIQSLSIQFSSVVSYLSDYSRYLKGSIGDGGTGKYAIKTSELYGVKFVSATDNFRTVKNVTPKDEEKPEEKEVPKEIKIELKPGDKGTINKKYIDFAKITDNAYGALQAEKGEGNWIPFEKMSPQWWGVYTNDEIEYEVRNDGTIWFIDTNSKGQKVYMGFTTVGVLTTCLTNQEKESNNYSDIEFDMMSDDAGEFEYDKLNEDGKNTETVTTEVTYPDEFYYENITPKERMNKRMNKAKELGISFDKYMELYYRGKAKSLDYTYEEYLETHYSSIGELIGFPDGNWDGLTHEQVVSARKSKAEELGISYKEYMNAYYRLKAKSLDYTYDEYIKIHNEDLAKRAGLPIESIPDAIKKADEKGITYDEYIDEMIKNNDSK